MTNTRIRCLTILFGIGLILTVMMITIIYLRRRPASSIGTNITCPRPKHYSSDYDFDYTTKSHEHRTVNSSIDYFRFSLSWSPTFCAGKKASQIVNNFQCQHDFGFIVHGLWPSVRHGNRTNNSSIGRAHPRNCRNEPAIPMQLIDKYFCLMPSEILMQAEWEKHGTCYWQTPDEYFRQISTLHGQLHLPENIVEIASNGSLLKQARSIAIKDAFLKLNSQVKTDQIDIIMADKGRRLKEVAFCYDLNFIYTTCNAH
jgi:ribonuclease T2